MELILSLRIGAALDRVVALPFQKNPVRRNWMGFGGAHFVIATNDGQLIHTNDLNVSCPAPGPDEPANARIVWSGGSGSGECFCLANAKRNAV